MTQIEVLLNALRYYDIPVKLVSKNRVDVVKNYSIEVEVNGLYKLYDNGSVIAPFDDIDELCRFILM